MRKFALILSVALVALLVFFVGRWGFGIWRSTRPSVSVSALRELSPGATRSEIERRFGPPQGVHDLYGDHRWCYYRKDSTKIVYVIFDTNMLYKGYELDD